MGQLLLPQAQTINAKLSTLNPNGINPKPQTLNSKSRTLHPALLGGTRVRVKGIGLRVQVPGFNFTVQRLALSVWC